LSIRQSTSFFSVAFKNLYGTSTSEEDDSNAFDFVLNSNSITSLNVMIIESKYFKIISLIS